MESEEQIKAIRLNKKIGNYNQEYCEICGKEIDVYENEQTIQDYLDNGKICEECRDNL
jgi:hypothetical protein